MISNSADPLLPDPPDGRLVIRVLGRLSISFGGSEITAMSRKVKALVAYLALTESGSETRERLVGLLWSQADEDHARGSLRQALRELRGHFERCGFTGLDANKTSITLDHNAIVVDVQNALRAAEAGRVDPILLETDEVIDTMMLEAEATDPAFRAWILLRRNAIEGRLVRQFEDRLRSSASTPAEKVSYARALMALDATHEEAAREIIRAKAAAKDIGGALAVYKTLWDTLEADYDVEPSTETQELIAQIKLEQPLTVPARAQPPAAPQVRATPPAPIKAPIIEFDDFDISGTKEQHRYIVQGFRRDLIARMVRFREWRVRDGAAGRRSDAEAFDDYVIEASAFDYGDEIRLAMLLRNRESGIYHWSERITISTANWIEVLQGTMRRLASVLNIHLSAARIEAATGSEYQNAAAVDLWLRGQAASASWSREGCQRAQALFEKSIRDFPDFAPAYSSLAQLQNSIHFWQPGTFRSQETERSALAYALDAVRFDPMDSRAHLCLGWAYAMAKRHGDAANHHRIAVELNENDVWTTLSAALGAASRADFAQALHLEEAAQQLNLALGPAHWGYRAQIAFLVGDYARCASAGEQAGSTIPSSPAWRIAALGHLGRQDEARQHAATFLRDIHARWQSEEEPSDAAITRWALHLFPFSNEKGWRLFREGLAKAGLPVGGLEFGA